MSANEQIQRDTSIRAEKDRVFIVHGRGDEYWCAGHVIDLQCPSKDTGTRHNLQCPCVHLRDSKFSRSITVNHTNKIEVNLKRNLRLEIFTVNHGQPTVNQRSTTLTK